MHIQTGQHKSLSDDVEFAIELAIRDDKLIRMADESVYTLLDKGKVRAEGEERVGIREELQEEDIGIELASIPEKRTIPLSSWDEQAEQKAWSKIKIWSAEKVVNKGRSRFVTWLATKLGQDETVVIIARDADEYRKVEYLKYDKRVHIKVVYGDTIEAQTAVDKLGLEPYQIIKDKTPEQLNELFTGLIIYGENGIDLKTLNDTIEMQREVAEDIASGV